LWKAYQKIHKFVDVIAYFSVQQWKFTDQNVQALQSRMTPVDQELFDFNIARLDWPSVFKTCMQGLRVHFAKEPLDNLQVAKKRYKRCSQEVLNNLPVFSSSLVVHR
jgi:fatty acyl-CoA reductase